MTTTILDASTDALLKRRAEQLARQPQAAELGDDVEVLVCRLGTERYAIDTGSLRAVRWEIVTLLDLGTMLGLTAVPGDAITHAVLLLGLPGLRAGLIVDEILGVERLKLASLQPTLSGREFVRGVGPGPTVLLDLE